MNTTTIHDLTPDTHPALWALLNLGDNAPERFWLRGDITALTARPAIAITGVRASTAYGEHIACTLVEDLARTHTIVTGAAYGIEAAATRAALGVGGRAVAATASGVDQHYPTGHRDLLEQLATRGGALLSEVEPGQTPTKERFLRRQRLIAALSRASVIIEAGARSGSLNVAEWSRELGRPVGAVPGPLTSACSTGTHALIRGGATLITAPNDIRAMLD